MKKKFQDMSDMSDMSDWLETDEGQKSIEDFVEKIKIKKSIENKQLERLKNSGIFNVFIEKVIIKYNSDNYRNKWYNLGIEPPEELYWFLFKYAEKYGRECNDAEWQKYGNMFTSALFYYEKYYFNRMDGQGSVIEITKIE